VDGWFVGFTNDVTIAVWVGYDNGDGKRRSLGSSESGAGVALPIFEPIIKAIWAQHIAPKTPLAGPSPEAKPKLTDVPIDYLSGDRVRDDHGFIEHFRLDAKGKPMNTEYQMEKSSSAAKVATEDRYPPKATASRTTFGKKYDWASRPDQQQSQQEYLQGDIFGSFWQRHFY